LKITEFLNFIIKTSTLEFLGTLKILTQKNVRTTNETKIMKSQQITANLLIQHFPPVNTKECNSNGLMITLESHLQMNKMSNEKR
jgi:hypothetical protein